MASDEIRFGYYKIRVVKGGPWCAARIWRPCRCTVNGGDEQREHAWRPSCDRYPPIEGLVDGKPFDPLKISLYGKPIDERTYLYLLQARP